MNIVKLSLRGGSILRGLLKDIYTMWDSYLVLLLGRGFNTCIGWREFGNTCLGERHFRHDKETLSELKIVMMCVI